MYYYFWNLYLQFLRPIIKWFLRKTTHQCELQRICYGSHPGAERTLGIEKSLELTRSPQIKRVIRVLDDETESLAFVGANKRVMLEAMTRTIQVVKKVNPRVYTRFISQLWYSIDNIWSYKQLLYEVEDLRTMSYDSSNDDHESKLMQLWDNLMLDERLEARVTKQWQKIGFQGDDPKTDFRGMGLLGLENLVYFSDEFRTAARHVLSHSHHPVYGYCFAIVGINLTSMACTLLRDGTAKTYFYNQKNEFPSLRMFHWFYSYLFYEFDKFWVACRPQNIMEFSNVRNEFEKRIRIALQDVKNDFRIRLKIDKV